MMGKARKGDLVVAKYRRRAWAANGTFTHFRESWRLAEVMSATRDGIVKTARDTATTLGADSVGDGIIQQILTIGKYARHPGLIAMFKKTGPGDSIEVGTSQKEAQDWFSEFSRTLKNEGE